MSLLLRFHELVGGFSIPIDDTLDKINRKYSIILMLFLALPIITKQFVGDPIECFTPTYYTEAQSRYVNSFCWTSSTYYVPPDDDSDSDDKDDERVFTVDMDYPDYRQFMNARKKFNFDAKDWEEEKVRVSYYQWAPIILLVQGAFFHMPFIIWSSSATNGGVQLRRILKRVREISQLPRNSPQRDSMVAELVEQFQCLTGIAKNCHRSSTSCQVSCLCRRGPSRYLFLLYLFVKVLYLGNVWLQFYLLSQFLGEEFLNHGFNIASQLISDGEWWISPRFPLQTLCKVRGANQGQLRTLKCQCVLPINLFNEKIFSIVWFYLAFLLPLNVYGIIVWIWRGLSCNRRSFIKYYLWRIGVVVNTDIASITDRLIYDYIGWDGVFVLRLIEHNHSTTILADMFVKLYDNFSSNKTSNRNNPDPEHGIVVHSGSPTAPIITASSNTTWHVPFPAGGIPTKPARKSSKTGINSSWDKNQ
ncbi:Uncharacterised protein g702 [Pycnogonum litorale]